MTPKEESPLTPEITPAQIYRNLALFVADYVSLNFEIPFDLTNITEKKSTYKDFTKEHESQLYISQYSCYDISFLSCLSTKVAITLNNHMLGISEEEKKDTDGDHVLTFGQKFVGSQISKSIQTSISQNYTCNYLKSGERLNLFRLFFADDKVLTYKLTCNIDDEEIGQLTFCHLENFFELLNKQKKEATEKENNEATNKQPTLKDEKETK